MTGRLTYYDNFAEKNNDKENLIMWFILYSNQWNDMT